MNNDTDNCISVVRDNNTKMSSISAGSLLECIYNNIKTMYTEKQAKAFMNNRELSGANRYCNSVQRGLANRVIINKLLIHRAHHETCVVDAIYCLVPDGTNESWMRVFNTIIAPFLAENKVEL